ncbi:MAG: N-6 DNA methylase, partial [Chloroflexales bacterium]
VPLAQVPARGVLEVKGLAADLDKLAGDEQVRRYLARYGQVLVTNYREFLLVGRVGVDTPVKLERYSLAPSETAFWQALARPEQLAAAHADGLIGYLQRVMLANAPLADPKDVAWFLASYARDARARVERAGKLPALAALKTALEDALGIAFQAERGEHFFRSTLVQTLFYGLFSAWVLWSKEHPEPAERFSWKEAAWHLHVPMITTLFGQMAQPEQLQPLGLVEVLNWTGAALNRVDRAAFFERFEAGLAVQYFYEPFLEAFDPALRKELGVWYTPPELVRYQVERVDRALRDELGLAAGLADPRVHVLDPCCGTGAYLVEVLRKIAATLQAQGSDDLLGEDVKAAACQRIFGFELLPAPFVVAHLQLGLLLQSLHAPLTSADERVGVYLTNALTGWEPPDVEKEQVVQLHLSVIPALQEERDLARQVKREAPILVIIGNPPYSGYAGMAQLDEERDLSEAYRKTKLAPAPQGQGLNDLYVRFFRMAERRIIQSGQGLICYIANYSWLDGLSFTGMREHYLEVFDQIWVDNLNGDKYRTGKLTPEGLPDPSVFSTPTNPEGIQVGTAIALLVRRQQHVAPAALHVRNLWGKTKRAELLDSLTQPLAEPYTTLQPSLALGLPFAPTHVDAAYLAWPLLTELFPASFPGIQTARDAVLVAIDREL